VSILEDLAEGIRNLLHVRSRLEAGDRVTIETDENETGETLSKILVVGLGNPGSAYAKNRHNIGFMLVDKFAAKHEIGLGRKKHNAIFGTGRVGDSAIILAKPQTFMNRSGNSVGKLSDYYDVEVSDILVVYDEIDLPFGTLRIREKGGSGGHNGMRSVIDKVGRDFPRIRLGVDRPPGRMDPADYVLSDFREEEWPLVDEMIATAVGAIEMIISDGLDLAMTQYNGASSSNP
jgi:PTH1 family peptidyl-tRNA hydrolase